MNTTTQQQPARSRTKRRYYEEQFKRDAVALLEGGRGATQLARELGVSQWNLRDWKEHYGTASPVALAVELADLRRELDATIRQRDILKKALAIVAQEHPNSMR